MTERYMYGAINDRATAGRPVPRPLVTRHWPALPALSLEGRPQEPPNESLFTVFLTGTPKQLEIAVTHTKQTTEAVSNRDKNTTAPDAIGGTGTARAPVFVGLVVRPAAFWGTGGCAARFDERNPGDVTRHATTKTGAQSAVADAPTTEKLARHPSLACPEAAAAAERVTRHCIPNRDSKLLETAVTQTKQTTEVVSNRDKIAGSSDAI